MIDFAYVKVVINLVQLMLIASIFSSLVMFTTEKFKRPLKKAKCKSCTFVYISLIISIIFSFAIVFSFGKNSMNIYDAMWLSYFTWLGSNGLFKYLENKKSFLGELVNSYSDYILKSVDTTQKK